MDVLRWLRAEWDRVSGFGLVGLGAALLLLGYRGVSGSPYVAEQLAYIISGGVGGLFMLGCGATLLVSADLHDEWRKLDRIEAAIRGETAVLGARTSGTARPDESPAASGSPGPLPSRGRFVASPLSTPPQAASEARTRSRLPLVVDDGARRARRAAGVAVLALAGAGIVVAVGWDDAAGSADPRPAIAGLTTAVSGLTLAGVVVVTYTLWQKRRVRDREVRLLAPYVLADAVRSLPVPTSPPGAPATSGEVLTAPGLTRFHRPGCPALMGVAGAVPVSPDSVHPDLRPCGICGTG